MSHGPAVTVRPAREDEAAEVARLWLASRRASVPRIPPSVHTDEEVLEWFTTVVFPSAQEVWVVERAGHLVAMLVTEGTWIEHLYVHPGWTGQGLGARLIEFAQSKQTYLQLWTFQSNLGARRFYERHEFVARELTDGDNEECAPDVRYDWRLLTDAEPGRGRPGSG